jgi:hypothetical protein
MLLLLLLFLITQLKLVLRAIVATAVLQAESSPLLRQPL